MKNYIERLRLLPRSVRKRMMISFSLMAVIPIMAGVYAITVHIANRRVSEWLSVVFLTCIVLACLGFVIMRAAVWSVVDISKTIEDVLPPLEDNKNISKITDDDIVLFERLIVYMENQMHQARKRLEQYRKLRTAQAPFRLPPLVPRSIVRERIWRELKLAGRNKYPVSIIAVRENNPSTEHIIDDTRLPQWLARALREAGSAFDGIGVWCEGQWVLWIRKQSSAEVKHIKETIADVLPPDHVNQVSLRIWSHPLHGLETSEFIAALDTFGARE
jgi:hypothetical protein